MGGQQEIRGKGKPKNKAIVSIRRRQIAISRQGLQGQCVADITGQSQSVASNVILVHRDIDWSSTGIETRGGTVLEIALRIVDPNDFPKVIGFKVIRRLPVQLQTSRLLR